MKPIDGDKLLDYLSEKISWYSQQDHLFDNDISVIDQIIAKVESGTFNIEEPQCDCPFSEQTKQEARQALKGGFQ